MPRIVKNNAILHAELLEEPITAPGPGGEEIVIARPGMWATYTEEEDGFSFKGFLTAQEFLDKHKRIN